MCNYWLGGHDHYDADRQLADQIERACLPVPQMVRDSREFARRAVTWAASRHGIRAYIDLGSGLLSARPPSARPVHCAARAVIPGAGVAYVDSDAYVAYEASRHLQGDDGAILVHADLRDPGAVLADPDLGTVIGLDEPVMVLLTLVLQLMSAGEARAVIAGYARQLRTGSVIAVSVPRVDDPASFARVQDLWPGELHNHTRAEIASFLHGLELVPPGLVLARGWRGEMPQADVQPGAQRTYVLGATAYKP